MVRCYPSCLSTLSVTSHNNWIDRSQIRVMHVGGGKSGVRVLAKDMALEHVSRLCASCLSSKTKFYRIIEVFEPQISKINFTGNFSSESLRSKEDLKK